MQISHHNEVNNDVSTMFEIKHCYLASSNKKHFTIQILTQITLILLMLQKQLDLMLMQIDKAKSVHSQYSKNKFTHGEYGIVAAFPCVFMFERAYNKSVSNLTQNDCIPLLTQFSAVTANRKHPYTSRTLANGQSVR